MIKTTKLSEKVFSQITSEIFDTMDNVIDSVTLSLPKTFPPEIAESVFNGMRTVKNRFS